MANPKGPREDLEPIEAVDHEYPVVPAFTFPNVKSGIAAAVNDPDADVIVNLEEER
ncbi:MAG: hypothetical protein US89_C0007G0040 [Candidatus Peregrinibacteria bacterium GW2011_GWF2_38_29]|nr:MAG: hypothetical protein US89_C0007G0040 [Candidatus Peregrinibacteria bacterium GW2011_GWF2_38_29]